jgi:hypothetical protein
MPLNGCSGGRGSRFFRWLGFYFGRLRLNPRLDFRFGLLWIRLRFGFGFGRRGLSFFFLFDRRLALRRTFCRSLGGIRGSGAFLLLGNDSPSRESQAKRDHNSPSKTHSQLEHFSLAFALISQREREIANK